MDNLSCPDLDLTNMELKIIIIGYEILLLRLVLYRLNME